MQGIKVLLIYLKLSITFTICRPMKYVFHRGLYLRREANVRVSTSLNAILSPEFK